MTGRSRADQARRVRQAEARQAARDRAAARKAAEAPAADPEATLSRINELSRTARTLWFGLLTYFAFVGVTLLGVSDADFFLVERQTELPLIGVSIPTNLFFYFAPVLGVAFYTYLHHHLMKLWDALAEAPPLIRNLPLSDHLIPWIVTDMALDLRPDRSLRPQPLPVLANAVTLLLVFFATPAILAGFWWRSMPAHSWWMTLVCCGLSLLLSLFVMAESGKALWRLRRPTRRAERAAGPRYGWRTVMGWTLTAAVLTGIGYSRTVEPIVNRQDIERYYSAFLNWRYADQIARGEYYSPVWVVESWGGYGLAEAQLGGVVFVEKPPGWRDFQTARAAFKVAWCRNEGLPPEICGPVPTAVAVPPAYLDDQRNAWCVKMFPDEAERANACPAHLAAMDDRFAADWKTERVAGLAALPDRDLSRRDMRGAYLYLAQLEGADLSRAQMEGALLSEAQMEGADLSNAEMKGADLSNADMKGANLWGAELKFADLSAAQMEGADLSFANMQNATIEVAQLQGAVLNTTDMAGADLSGAQLQGALLYEAQLQRANLREAQMEGAVLIGAQMEGAVLSYTQMEGANLRGANLQSADLSDWSIARASLRSADLTGAKNLDQDTLNSAWGDSGTILPDSFLRPDHWDSQTDFISDLNEDKKYQDWIAAGAPPGKPVP